jgi:hypothetical protein
MTRPIFFLTDFGLTDTYVGIVKAVILGIAPAAQIVDLTHDVPPQDVRAGAFALLTAAPYLPADAIVLAIVDPGVGTTRRPIAVQAGGRTFFGPDNGLLSWVVEPVLAPQPRESALTSDAEVPALTPQPPLPHEPFAALRAGWGPSAAAGSPCQAGEGGAGALPPHPQHPTPNTQHPV